MQKFSTSFNGYNKDEVNKFLNDVTKEYENMLNKLKESDAKIASLEQRLAEQEGMQSALKKALILADESNKELKRVAKDESLAIVEDAKKNASRIVNDALIRATKIEADAEALKRRVITYKKRVKQTISEQLELVEAIDENEF